MKKVPKGESRLLTCNLRNLGGIHLELGIRLSGGWGNALAQTSHWRAAIKSRSAMSLCVPIGINHFATS